MTPEPRRRALPGGPLRRPWLSARLAARPRPTLLPAWRAPLAWLAAAWLALIALAAADWAAMIHQWWAVSTYAHLLLVPAILAWLVWARRDALARLTPRAWAPGAGLFALAVALWAVGRLAGMALVAQAGAVALLAACVPALLGVEVSAALLFPVAYMAFLVPVGDEAIPLLQGVTARITVALVHWTGVPAQIDGVFITTPVGLFEIAEACSGMKFLAAMVAFGVLAANVCFVSWRRRLAFVAACVVVPVLANGVRAWGTVYVAQYVGPAVAGGIDHVIYGWFFFAAVIAGTIAAGSRFFDRPAAAPMIDIAAIRARPWLARAAMRAAPRPLLAAALAALAAAGAGWVAAANALVAPVPAGLAAPAVPGWRAVAPGADWQPRADGAARRRLLRYVDAAGDRVDVFVAVWAVQREGAKADGFGEGAWTPDSIWGWIGPAPAPAAYAPGEASGDRLLGNGRVHRLALTTYAHGGWSGGRPVALRGAVFADRLRLRARATAVLIVSACDAPGHPAAASIAAFRAAAGPAGAWLARAGGGPGG